MAGIDAGGTKTTAVLLDVDGHGAGVGRGGPANAVFVPRATAVESLRHAILEAAQGATAPSAPSGPVESSGGFGLAAIRAGMPGPPGVLEEVVNGLPFAVGSALNLGEDLTSLVGARLTESGVIVVAGTGSRAAAITVDGRHFTAGGWGSVFSDEGSAYAIGAAALSAALKDAEGRGPATVLGERIREAWRLDTLRGVVSRVYGAPDRRGVVASLGPIVAAAAAAGDEMARAILAAAARDLAELAAAVVRKAGREALGTPAEVFGVGGAFRAGPALTAPLEAHLVSLIGPVRLRRPRLEPAVGAALLAAKAAGGSWTGDLVAAVERLAQVHGLVPDWPEPPPAFAPGAFML